MNEAVCEAKRTKNKEEEGAKEIKCRRKNNHRFPVRFRGGRAKRTLSLLGSEKS